MNSTPTPAPTPFQITQLARTLFNALSRDISDRCGIKHAWKAIAEDVMQNDLKPTWEALIAKHVTEMLHPPHMQSQGQSTIIPNGAALLAVCAEIDRATGKFPTWPTDPLHALAILSEEFGELSKAMVQLTYEPHKTSLDDVKEEAVQCAAMALRLVMSLNTYRFTPSAQHSQVATPPAKAEEVPPKPEMPSVEEHDDSIVLRDLSAHTIVRLRSCDNWYLLVTDSAAHPANLMAGVITDPEGRTIVRTQTVFTSVEETKAYLQRILDAAKRWKPGSTSIPTMP